MSNNKNQLTTTCLYTISSDFSQVIHDGPCVSSIRFVFSYLKRITSFYCIVIMIITIFQILIQTFEEHVLFNNSLYIFKVLSCLSGQICRTSQFFIRFYTSIIRHCNGEMEKKECLLVSRKLAERHWSAYSSNCRDTRDFGLECDGGQYFLLIDTRFFSDIREKEWEE